MEPKSVEWNLTYFKRDLRDIRKTRWGFQKPSSETQKTKNNFG